MHKCILLVRCSVQSKLEGRSLGEGTIYTHYTRELNLFQLKEKPLSFLYVPYMKYNNQLKYKARTERRVLPPSKTKTKHRGDITDLCHDLLYLISSKMVFFIFLKRKNLIWTVGGLEYALCWGLWI